MDGPGLIALFKTRRDENDPAEDAAVLKALEEEFAEARRVS